MIHNHLYIYNYSFFTDSTILFNYKIKIDNENYTNLIKSFNLRNTIFSIHEIKFRASWIIYKFLKSLNYS